MIELMAELRDRGYRMAMLTNNVREWEPLWRAKLPVDEIFETVVDSAFVGMRKPDHEIYELTRRAARRDRGRGVPVRRRHRASTAIAARELGMTAVHFRRQRAGDPGDKVDSSVADE